MSSAEKSFDKTLHRNSGHTFDKPPSTVKEKVSNVPKTAAMDNKAMAQIIASSQRSDEKIYLVQLMEHLVTEECLSIFNIRTGH